MAFEGTPSSCTGLWLLTRGTRELTLGTSACGKGVYKSPTGFKRQRPPLDSLSDKSKRPTLSNLLLFEVSVSDPSDFPSSR